VYKAIVLGTSGAGKSTVAAALATLYEVSHVDLDDLATGPNWSNVPDDEFRARVRAVLDTPGWVIDGDFQRKLGDLVLSRAEIAIWLDLPLRTSLVRMSRRTFHLIRNQVELGHRNRLTWNLGLLGWLLHEIRSHLRRRIKMNARLAGQQHLSVVRLRTQRQVDSWLTHQQRQPRAK
jgi:adenylate kinase family enzyme